jgi:hypothetical protein
MTGVYGVVYVTSMKLEARVMTVPAGIDAIPET